MFRQIYISNFDIWGTSDVPDDTFYVPDVVTQPESTTDVADANLWGLNFAKLNQVWSTYPEQFNQVPRKWFVSSLGFHISDWLLIFGPVLYLSNEYFMIGLEFCMPLISKLVFYLLNEYFIIDPEFCMPFMFRPIFYRPNQYFIVGVDFSI